MLLALASGVAIAQAHFPAWSGRVEIDIAQALDRARAMLADGADVVDVGGESTRPGAAPVDEATELARVVPVIEALAREGALVSVDTTKPGVMRTAIGAGAAIVNDVGALGAPGAPRPTAKTISPGKTRARSLTGIGARPRPSAWSTAMLVRRSRPAHSQSALDP